MATERRWDSERRWDTAPAWELESYWHDRMQERQPLRDEVTRLTTVLKGFFLDEVLGEEDRWDSLLAFYEGDDRPYGAKDVAESIAFNLGWDAARVLCTSPMPDRIRAEALEVHRLVGEKIREK